MSQQNDDFISFEKALRDLKMQSDQLRKLVSEGEIRAFRDGDSMKFRREDLESLRRNKGSEELVFSDSIEDDTGMVTEEISAEDTLLADDEELIETAPRATATSTSAAGTNRGARARSGPVDAETGEPTWVLAASIIGAALMLLGLAQAYWINSELPPTGIMSMWAKQ